MSRSFLNICYLEQPFLCIPVSLSRTWQHVWACAARRSLNLRLFSREDTVQMQRCSEGTVNCVDEHLPHLPSNLCLRKSNSAFCIMSVTCRDKQKDVKRVVIVIFMVIGLFNLFRDCIRSVLISIGGHDNINMFVCVSGL